MSRTLFRLGGAVFEVVGGFEDRGDFGGTQDCRQLFRVPPVTSSRSCLWNASADMPRSSCWYSCRTVGSRWKATAAEFHSPARRSV
jgi:hypothetical protein